MRHEIVKSRKARSTTPGSSHAIDSLYLPEGEYLIIHYGDEINAGTFSPTRSTMTIARRVHSKRIYNKIRSMPRALRRLPPSSHFNDTVEIHLIKRDGYGTPALVTSFPYGRAPLRPLRCSNNCLTGWKDESRPVTLDYRSRRRRRR